MAGSGPSIAVGVPLTVLLVLAAASGAWARPESSVEVDRLAYFLMQHDFGHMADALLPGHGFRDAVAKALGAAGGVTILAPTDEAVRRFNSSRCSTPLEKALLLHVLPGRILGDALENAAPGTQYPALSGLVVANTDGSSLTLRALGAVDSQTPGANLAGVQGQSATVGRLNAHVTRRVVVHVVDAVLDPLGDQAQGIAHI